MFPVRIFLRNIASKKSRKNKSQQYPDISDVSLKKITAAGLKQRLEEFPNETDVLDVRDRAYERACAWIRGSKHYPNSVFFDFISDMKK